MASEKLSAENIQNVSHLLSIEQQSDVDDLEQEKEKPCLQSCLRFFWEGWSRIKTYIVVFASFVLLMCLILAILFFGGNSEAKTRVYYIAAETVTWDYAPSGRNLVENRDFQGETELKFMTQRTYSKALFFEYTDATFTRRVSRSKQQRHLGLLGPVLRAETGDTIDITFLNRLHFNCNIDSPGIPVAQKDKTRMVRPNETVVFSWYIPTLAGPSLNDPSSVVWTYSSTVDEVKDANSGLIGPIVITRKGYGREDATPLDVDSEFFILFGVFDESSTHFNISAKTTVTRDTIDKDSNLKRSINGFMYGNLQGLNMLQGEETRWYLFTNDKFGVHIAHWQGSTVVSQGIRTDAVQLFPGIFHKVDLFAYRPGQWQLRCLMSSDSQAGMVATYKIAQTDEIIEPD